MKRVRLGHFDLRIALHGRKLRKSDHVAGPRRTDRTLKPSTTLLLEGELLVCVLGGVYTNVEKTMIELQHATTVHQTRSTFHTAMQHKFIAAIERLSGRKVLTFMSNHHVGPDIEIKVFMLKPGVPPHPNAG